MRAFCRFIALGTLVLVLVSLFVLVADAQDDTADQVLNRINSARADANLPPLARNGALDAAAQAHAIDLLKNGASLGHRGSDGSNIQQRIYGAGYTGGTTGENWAAYRSLDLIFNFWLDDPPHRRNILNAKFTEIGIGIASRPNGGLIVITDFGGPGAGAESNVAPKAAAVAAPKKAKATVVPTRVKPKPTAVPPTRKPTRKPTVVPPTVAPTQTPAPKKIALAPAAKKVTIVPLHVRGKAARRQVSGIAQSRLGSSTGQADPSARVYGGALALGGVLLIGVAMVGHRRRIWW